jgi:hypothetical protein
LAGHNDIVFIFRGRNCSNITFFKATNLEGLLAKSTERRKPEMEWEPFT